jgi:hypothetical protein
VNKTGKGKEGGYQLEKIAVTTEELAEMLSCGIGTAKKIGERSGAKLDFGTRRVFWCVERVKEYLLEEAS